MKKITDENRLSQKRPALVNEWDYSKNAPLTPHDISFGSNRYVWWICNKCDYSWKAKVSNRAVLNRGCPCCANKTVVSGVNDLASRNPALAQEWHPTKNKDLTPDKVMLGTARKVWWLCPNGHSYMASVLHRGHGTNCPICHSGRQTSFAEKALYYYIKQVYPDAVHKDVEALGNRMELDIYIPTIKLGIEYDGAFWHEGTRAEQREKNKFARCQKLGINLLRIKEEEPSLKDSTARWTLFADPTGQNKNLAEIIQRVLDMIDPKSSFWFRNTVYPVPSVSVDLERDRFNIIGEMIEKRQWAQNYPRLIKEWHSTKNETRTLDMFSPQSDEKVWWRCIECSHEWKTAIGHRVRGTGCPACYRQNNRGKRHYLARRVYQYTPNGELLRIWDCISDAARELKLNGSNISTCAKGDRKSAGGYVWRYEADAIVVNEESTNQLSLDEILHKKHNK